MIHDVHIHVSKFSELNNLSLTFMSNNPVFVEHRRRLETDPKYLVNILDGEDVGKAVLINYVAPDTLGFTRDVNRFASEYCREFPDRLVPFGSIHPRFSQNPKAELEELYSKFEIKGIKLHPVHQLVYPNQYLEEFGPLRLKSLEILYDFCQQNNLPVTVHTGSSMFPTARNKYGDPLFLDDVAVDFPRLKIIMAHGGRPFWMQKAFFILRRHPNVYLDISGIPPKRLLDYFPRLEEIYEKTIFGSDWPSPGVKRISENAKQIVNLPISTEAKEAILRNNFSKLGL